MNEEERRWREEREKALDEWSEIELRFRSGTPVRINLQDDEDYGNADDGNHTQTIIERVLNDDYDIEKAAVLSEKTVTEAPLNSFVMRCICKPSVSLNSEELVQERLLLLAISKRSYNHEKACHWQLLKEFYRITAGLALADKQLASDCPRMGAHWQTVGFQGSDPSTDLRGVGLLGLLQLYCLASSMQEDKLREMVKLSRNEPHDFPFAVVGINFTSLLLTKLSNNELNELSNTFSSVLKAINILYKGCFVHFCKLWKEGSCTIKDFQHVLNAIGVMLKKEPHKLSRAYPV